MKKYNLVTPDTNEKTGKTYWLEVGSLFADDNATGINGASIKLNLFPGLKIKAYHRDRKQEHHSDTHEGGNVDTDPVEEPLPPTPDDDDISF